jgi:hypothetical protein
MLEVEVKQELCLRKGIYSALSVTVQIAVNIALNKAKNVSLQV